MAGIGFELRRVIGKGGLSRSLGAALSGILIVAGPWLMTILSFFFIRSIFSRSLASSADLFQVAVIYSYAVSISLFSGLHHHFTRIVADLIWEDRHAEASAWLVRFALAAAALSVALGGTAMAVAPLDLGGGALAYRIACVFLFATVNVMWIVMLFVSLLRRYIAILAIFAAGMAASVFLVAAWGGRWGPAGALFGYATGHAFTAAGLLALSFSRYTPAAISGGWKFAMDYARRYRALILSGFLFYLGQWSDKFVFWALRGSAVAGTPFRLYEAYDVPVYVAGLSIIPGLVYFVIYSETEIYASIRRFLNSLTHETLAHIFEAKERLGTDLRRELHDQTLFQLTFTFLAMLLVLAREPDGARRLVYLVALCGAFAQFTLMTLLNFLYYFELYERSLVATAVFFIANGLVFPLVQLLLPGLPPGSGFLCAGIAASAAAWALLLQAVPDMDRRIFLRTVRRN
ncbi:MAG: hypothetical protein A2Z99_13495 [Treponema sp. GWB1_62_6]|nr:MAG: hypothetical protein A2Y36_18515 [Treponema sp. GWA1_62_8]OHE67605.1 MAG: hypothetical protein A2001_19635 [Treponema sp. GWC1_61_84]OHE70022.1 MAG: hypothetical protein A2Z99_13495 [Treponema sp. GWB1_62_6]OHE70519.1 MAG: hypothetical protein A2413_19295 [Treponema sp. RIFOXYC1_FULL_61_9]HCM25848.1 hypothetical protein [Treponema sp.]